MDDTAEIVRRINAEARGLCRELLPNGALNGAKWICSGVWDVSSSGGGKGQSMVVNLSPPEQGKWHDFGNCAAGEQRGDMLDLIRIRLCNGDARAAFAEAKRRLGIDDRFVPGAAARPDPAEIAQRAEAARAAELAAQARLELDRARKVKSARALFLGEGARPIEGTPAELYLRGRGISAGAAGRWPGSLRFRDGLRHKPSESAYPALIAAGFDAAGQQRFCHRIWLAKRSGVWGKIDHAQAKMVLGPFWGSFVPIHRGKSDRPISKMAESEAVYVTEGIEDALVVRMLRPELRIICAVSLGNIGAIVLPSQARSLVIVADRDEHPEAQATLERAIAAQQARGLEVRLVMPPPGSKDVNDWLRSNPAMRGAA